MTATIDRRTFPGFHDFLPFGRRHLAPPGEYKIQIDVNMGNLRATINNRSPVGRFVETRPASPPRTCRRTRKR
jgi:hypothetical protein